MADKVKSITKKSTDISGWYNDVIAAAKLADHGPAKGTVIIRPYAYKIWERVQRVLDNKIKALGADNCYFPLLIPYSFIEKEKSHVAGFSPELAVVTHGGGEKLAEPLVVRPTSETIMYDAFSRWIQSFRDLPLKVNQWNNVVRWEKRPYLFLRTSEFLWQEGHTAHQTNEEAQAMVEAALKDYIDTYQSYLALFGYAGRKSESEKFAGADMTSTYEILAPDGKVIQGCTSHNLGQNFAKVFKIEFQDQNGGKQFVWQTSWGFSTRSLGALFLVHGDDSGLVLPPQIAPSQVVIIPIVSKGSDKEAIIRFSNRIFKRLESFDVRVMLDDSDRSPGWKFNQYDLEGVPIRIEIGATELKNEEVTLIARDNEAREVAKLENVATIVNQMLDAMQKRMFEKSKEFTLQNTHQADTYEEFKQIMETKRGFIEALWCEDPICEAKIKEETKATTRCLPFNSPKVEGKCVYCGKTANYRWLFAQSY